MVRACNKKGDAYRVLVGDSEAKGALGRLGGRWENSIKMDLREMSWGGMDCISLAQNRDQWRDFQNTVIRLRVCWTCWTIQFVDGRLLV
jgi:hypothetical protein